MRILLSNDDGILAPGLAALYTAVADLGDVTVVAPDSPQSAAGHAITLRHPLVVQNVRVGGADGFVGMSVDGRPADCVRLAVRNLLPRRPDLVLAGINAGSNLGINVFYSGTVAAAAEAVMFGLPAVAFSAEITGGEIDFRRIAGICRSVLDQLLADGLEPGELVSVNVPSLGPAGPKGVRVSVQSTAALEDAYVRDVDARGREIYQLGDEYGFAPHDEDTDVKALANGYVTVTPLKVDMTDYPRMEKLTRRQWHLPQTP